MKRSKGVRRVKVSADGEGVVSHAGVGLLREMAVETGLVDAVTAALADTYQGPWLHAPGRLSCDLAVAVADGADAISGIAVLTDHQDLHGPVTSMPTTWRVLDRVDSAHLAKASSGYGPTSDPRRLNRDRPSVAAQWCSCDPGVI